MVVRSRIAVFVLVLAGSLAVACGDFQDDSRPTPTPGPTSTRSPDDPSPTPTLPCPASDDALGCRVFSWSQNQENEISGTGFFASVDVGGGDAGNVGANFVLGSFLLVAGDGDESGVFPVELIDPAASGAGSPFILHAKLLVDALCIRLYPETSSGELYCGGRSGQGVDVRVSAPGGDYPRDQPRDQTLVTDLGDSAPPGSLLLRISFQQMRASEGPNADPKFCLSAPECGPTDARNCYEPAAQGVLTTGTAFVEKGERMLRLPSTAGQEPVPGLMGEPFDCTTWQRGDGPGRLVLPLTDFDPAFGNTAAALRLSDR